MSRPTIVIPCDVKSMGLHRFHAVGEKYINAIGNGSNGLPLLLPAWAEGVDLRAADSAFNWREILQSVDGLFLPGAPSNVNPKRYNGPEADMLLDEQRDELVFTLIEIALEIDLPILAVCRGFQELNVAFGGTIHAEVHAQDQFNDHRENLELSRELQYAPVHEVILEKGSRLSQWVSADRFMVNSLHTQGIDQVGAALNVEARADDGLVEAVSFPDKWVFGVQWHPEWRFAESEMSTALFKEFGLAASQRMRERLSSFGATNK